MFLCKVIINGNIAHEKVYTRLKEISDDLKLSYQQVADYSCGRIRKRQTNNFIYHPKIEIIKLSKAELNKI